MVALCSTPLHSTELFKIFFSLLTLQLLFCKKLVGREKIEGVQRRFTRRIEDIGLLPYSERLDILGLTTLFERRARGDLIEVYKAKHGFSLSSDLFRFSRSGLNPLSKFGHSPYAKRNALKRNCLGVRVRVYWNRLPFDVKMAV